MIRLHAVWLVLAALLCPPLPAGAATRGAAASSGERIYAHARPRLLQVRTLVGAASKQSSIGSGFLVSADGLAITNYHVVSQHALEPATYVLEYAMPSGERGPLRLLAIDVINDLAVVKLDRKDLPHFELDPRAIAGRLPKGERLYAMGNPLDLGFTIVDGTYNGLVDKSYTEQVHFSGALNPGMSGGPTVTAGGRVAGVNVARSLEGEQVSFLVPAHHADALLRRARSGAPLGPRDARAEIGRQLLAWQEGFRAALEAGGTREAPFGPYRAPESTAPWFQCWANTNADQQPAPRAQISTTRCAAQTSIFIAGDLRTGMMQFSHTYLKSVDLNAFQFAALTGKRYGNGMTLGFDRRRLTRQECHVDVLEAPAAGERPSLRVRWCARAYRDFDGLYDVSVTAVTQDRALDALVSQLTLQGVSWANGEAVTRRFLDAIRRAP